MPLTDSPILDGSSGDPLSPGHSNPHNRSKRRILSPVRILILCLALVTLLLGVVEFIIPDYGTVRGTVRDIDGRPLQAEVFISGLPETIRTDTTGRFALSHIPSGQRILTIRYEGDNFAFQIDVPPEDSLNIGQIQIDSGA